MYLLHHKNGVYANISLFIPMFTAVRRIQAVSRSDEGPAPVPALETSFKMPLLQ